MCLLFKKKYFNNEGSTLLAVIIYFMILLTLGAVLLTVSYSHFKLTKVEQSEKIAFYAAESAINEAFSHINGQTENIFYQSNDKALVTVNNFLLNELEILENTRRHRDFKLIDFDGNVLVEEFNKMLLKELKREYKNAIGSNNFKEWLQIVLKELSTAGMALELDEDLELSDSDDSYKFSLTSIEKSETTNRTILKTEFKINVPETISSGYNTGVGRRSVQLRSFNVNSWNEPDLNLVEIIHWSR